MWEGNTGREGKGGREGSGGKEAEEEIDGTPSIQVTWPAYRHVKHMKNSIKDNEKVKWWCGWGNWLKLQKKTHTDFEHSAEQAAGLLVKPEISSVFYCFPNAFKFMKSKSDIFSIYVGGCACVRMCLVCSPIVYVSIVNSMAVLLCARLLLATDIVHDIKSTRK